LAGVVYVQLLDVGFNDVAHELRVRCEKLYSIFKRRDFYFDASDLYLIRWVVTED
jgi:predicted HTH domain antitoxin